MRTPLLLTRPARQQRGAALVELALVASAFLLLLVTVLEVGRIMFVYNSLQEVARRAAREATLHWVTSTDQATVKSLALFGGTALPGGPEITSASITIEYLKANGDTVTSFPSDASDNLSACSDATRTDNCVYSVRVSITNARYTPLLSLFGSSVAYFTLPSTSVTMHAESMGFDPS